MIKLTLDFISIILIILICSSSPSSNENSSNFFYFLLGIPRLNANALNKIIFSLILVFIILSLLYIKQIQNLDL